MRSLSSIGELEFISAIRRIVESRPHRGVVLGIGDDAACLRLRADAVVTVDSMVEGVHFRRSWLAPRELGRRIFRVSVSDLSASGATPRFAVLALGLPRAFPLDDALALMRGLVNEGARAGVALVGGNVSASPVFSASLTMIGEAGPRLLRRDAARAGDIVYVTGPLGAAAAGVSLLRHGITEGQLQTAYRRPPLRVAAGRALARLDGIGAVIDVSDGLVQDLSHVCRASRVSATLDVASVPMLPALRRLATARSRERLGAPARFALTGGDDYELLFTVRASAARTGRVETVLDRAGCTPRAIGRIIRPACAPVLDDRDSRPLSGGYDHFAEARS